MHIFRLTLCVALLGLARLDAQTAPAVGRPPQYSGVEGQYALEVTAAPTTVHVEEPITLRVRIVGRGQPPRRERLRLFPPGWERDFYIEEVPAEDQANPKAGTWDFVYRLRPKQERVQGISGLKLVYYHPQRQRYQTAYQEPEYLPLSVKPRPARAEDWEVAAARAPASFYALAPVDVESANPQAGWGWVVLVVIGPPLACWLGARRRLGGRAAAGHAAAQRALKELEAGAEPAWLVLARYLRERLGYAGVEPTPADVARFLKRRGFARSLIEEARAFHAACDAARFAPSSGAADHLRGEAIRLIGALETDKCLA